MPQYFMAYRGGRRPASKEEGIAHMTKWRAWVAACGDALQGSGTMLKNTKTVSTSGVQDTADPMPGFSILQADSLEKALEIARKCPHLDLEGTIDVAEMQEMPS
ncbi:MAG: YciI family protein [Pseudomonadota bacterium]